VTLKRHVGETGLFTVNDLWLTKHTTGLPPLKLYVCSDDLLLLLKIKWKNLYIRDVVLLFM